MNIKYPTNKINLALLLGINFCLPTQLSSNDSTATIAGGVITYQQNDDISMDQEILQISLKNIMVNYKFTNHSLEDITTTVVFPLPPSPVTLYDTNRVQAGWDDVHHAYDFIDQALGTRDWGYHSSLSARTKSQAFTNFETIVNEGTPSQHYKSHKMKIVALDKDGKDITEVLKQKHIPLSASYIGGYMEEPIVYRDPELKKKLSDLELINEIGLPKWQTHITYCWDQVFPSQKTISVSHSYAPHPGDFWISTDTIPTKIDDIKLHHRDLDSEGKEENKKLSDYNISKQDIPTLLKLFDKIAFQNKKADTIGGKQIGYRVQEVQYILTTGANWKGPIKSFRLEIIPPSKTCMVFASFNGTLKKAKNGNYVFTAKDFKPTKDLKILFVDPKKTGF